MIPETNLDYVEYYAGRLRENPELFRQQKSIIESQLRGSFSLFRNMFGKGRQFKSSARKYLKSISRI